MSWSGSWGGVKEVASVALPRVRPVAPPLSAGGDTTRGGPGGGNPSPIRNQDKGEKVSSDGISLGHTHWGPREGKIQS